MTKWKIRGLMEKINALIGERQDIGCDWSEYFSVWIYINHPFDL